MIGLKKKKINYTNKMKIEFKVESHYPLIQSEGFYTVHWRKKYKFWIGCWHEIKEVFDGTRLKRYSSKTFRYLKDAVSYAENLKSSPSLLELHEKEQDKIYAEAKERRKTEYHPGEII
jgi:hypothetical protein